MGKLNTPVEQSRRLYVAQRDWDAESSRVRRGGKPVGIRYTNSNSGWASPSSLETNGRSEARLSQLEEAVSLRGTSDSFIRGPAGGWRRFLSRRGVWWLESNWWACATRWHVVGIKSVEHGSCCLRRGAGRPSIKCIDLFFHIYKKSLYQFNFKQNKIMIFNLTHPNNQSQIFFIILF